MLGYSGSQSIDVWIYPTYDTRWSEKHMLLQPPSAPKIHESKFPCAGLKKGRDGGIEVKEPWLQKGWQGINLLFTSVTEFKICREGGNETRNEKNYSYQMLYVSTWFKVFIPALSTPSSHSPFNSPISDMHSLYCTAPHRTAPALHKSNHELIDIQLWL